MSKLPGYKVVCQFDSKTLVGYRKHEMTAEADMADATTGASTNQWKETQPLFKGMEFSIEGLYDPTAGGNETFDDAYTLLANGTQFTAKYGGTEAGDTYWQASAYVRRVRHGADYTDLSDYSIDVVVDGEPTEGTVSA